MGLNILIGTAVLWGLTALVVMPLAQLLARQRQVGAAQSAEDSGVSEAAGSIPTDCFILADVLVLSAVGFLFGAASGYFFVGLALSWKHWPGMICFILCSLLGAALHG